MAQKAKIGAGQLFSLLFICRMLTTVTFSPALGDGYLDGNFFINILFACFFIIFLCVPSALFAGRFKTEDPVSVLEEKSKSLSASLALFYSFVFLFFASVSVSRFFIFLTSVIFPEKNMNILLVISVLLCAYCAFLGIEAIARGNALLLVITLTGTAVILFFVSKDFDIYNLEPPFYESFSSSLKSALWAAGRTVEASAFLFLFKMTNGKIKKGFFICLSSFFVSLSLLFLFLNGVSGEFAKTQLFPFYSLAVIASFPFFERLDAVATAVWIFSILIKCSLFLFISGEIISHSFKMKRKTALLICFAVISIASLLFSVNLSVHRAVSSSLITGTLTVLSAFIVPSILLITRGRRREI